MNLLPLILWPASINTNDSNADKPKQGLSTLTRSMLLSAQHPTKEQLLTFIVAIS